MGSDYSTNDLLQYNSCIEEMVLDAGLNTYPQEFEICSYEDKATKLMPRCRYVTPTGAGKAYERKKPFIAIT